MKGTGEKKLHCESAIWTISRFGVTGSPQLKLNLLTSWSPDRESVCLGTLAWRSMFHLDMLHPRLEKDVSIAGDNPSFPIH